MNIIEAIKSGRRFRRRGQPRYLELFHDIDLCLSAVDITADDWEVEKQSTINAVDFDRAWNRAQMDPLAYVHYYGQLPRFETIINEFKERVKKELGL